MKSNKIKSVVMMLAALMMTSAMALSSCSTTATSSSSGSSSPTSTASNSSTSDTAVKNPISGNTSTSGDSSSSTDDNASKVSLSSIAVSRNGTALSVNNSNKISETYNVGDTFSTEGLTVEATYSDGSTADVDIANCKISNTEALTVNDTALIISYTEKDVTKSATLRLDVQAPEITSVAYTGKTEILFSDTTAYTLSGGASKGTWTSSGEVKNTFDRLRCNKKTGAYITFQHDFSNLADRSKAGFMSTLNASRGGTVIEVSNDNVNWETLSKAGVGDNQITAKYKYIAKYINNLDSTDTSNNVYYMYYEVGEYLTNSSMLYVRYSYQAPEDGFVGQDTEGADLIHSVAFYDTLDLSKAGEEPAEDAKLSSLEVTTQPTKTTYEVGDTFDPAGMVVTATYSDGSTAEVSVANYTLSDTTFNTIGEATVKVSYTFGDETREAEIPVTVTAKAKTTLEESDYTVAAELLFNDASNYTLNKATKGASRYFTDEEGTEAARLRCNSTAGAYILFTYTFADDVDLSKAGFMTYALDSRMGTVIEYSTDNVNWTTLAKVAEGDTRVSAQYKESATNIVGTKGGTNTDSNMKKMYYNVDMGEAKTLYVKISFVDPGWASYPSGTSKEGADIFGSITFYSSLDLSWVK